MDFERRLYVTRRTIERAADASPALAGKIFYVCSMSSRTIVYKGMLVATQMRRFYLDLNDAAVETALALVHSRYSTNTTPSWERAHPNRYLIHNGEINTLRGNVSWVRAREPRALLAGARRRPRARAAHHQPRGLDSAILDNVLEFLVMNGRALDRAVTLMMPGAVGQEPGALRPPPRLRRLPVHAHGALGRPCGDRLHRRSHGGRRARPQRPAPGALLRDARRPADPGLRGGHHRRRPRKRPLHGLPRPWRDARGATRPGSRDRQRRDP